MFPADAYPGLANHPDNLVAVAAECAGGGLPRKAYRHAKRLASTPAMREHLHQLASDVVRPARRDAA